MPESRVLSGMRPTGRLHFGHYHGVLANWLDLQNRHECFFFIADWHALTTEYADPSGVKGNIQEMLLDWLSVGIDPARSSIFIQSSIKEHAELMVLLSMITPLPWLERNPTYKEQRAELVDKDVNTFGFLGYPVLQTADIIIYKAHSVPVGVDQAPHVELSREITRRFNNLYGKIFPEPKTLLTKTPKVLGTDGRKMSKSYNNAIFLSDAPEEVEKKMLTMMTDTARKRKSDPGNPDICPFYETFHALYSDAQTIEWVRKGCTNAEFGCIECKKSVIPKVLDFLRPIQEKRHTLEQDPEMLMDILSDGKKTAAAVAAGTMAEVRAAMGLDFMNLLTPGNG